MTTDRLEAAVCLIKVGLPVGRACKVMRMGRARFYLKQKDRRLVGVIDALKLVLR